MNNIYNKNSPFVCKAIAIAVITLFASEKVNCELFSCIKSVSMVLFGIETARDSHISGKTLQFCLKQMLVIY